MLLARGTSPSAFAGPDISRGPDLPFGKFRYKKSSPADLLSKNRGTRRRCLAAVFGALCRLLHRPLLVCAGMVDASVESLVTSARFRMFPKNDIKRWLVLYRAALLEPDMQKMPERIARASKALQERSVKLQGSRYDNVEKLELEYAIRNLHAAERMK